MSKCNAQYEIENCSEGDACCRREASESPALLSGNESSVYIYAARYAHHRATGAALQVVSEILNNWDRLPKQVQGQLKREAQEVTSNHDDWQRLIAR